jgi:hypothetical protein
MRKYRIVEKPDFTGEICFIPQYKKMWMWVNFYELDCFPKLVKFYSLASARDFILKQKLAPETKIHYF